MTAVNGKHNTGSTASSPTTTSYASAEDGGRIDVERSSARKTKTQAAAVRSLGAAFVDDDESDEDLDALRWIERSRRRQREQQAADAAAKKEADRKHKASKQKQPAQQYSSSDLAGVKVAHSLADFASVSMEGHVLTLQDKNIDELDQGDEAIELHSSELAEVEKARKNIDMRKTKLKKMGVETSGELLDVGSGDGEGKGDTESKKFFTIKDGGVIDQMPDDEREHHEQRVQRGQIAVPLDFGIVDAAPVTVSDFYTEAEAAKMFRKSKSKSGKKSSKKSSSSKRSTTTNDFTEIVDAERVNSILTRKDAVDDSKYADDDDDMQRAIARVRRSAVSKRKAPTAEEIASRVHQEVQARMDVDPATNSASDAAKLVLSSTTEFVQALRAATATTTVTTTSTAIDPDTTDDVQMKGATPSPEPLSTSGPADGTDDSDRRDDGNGDEPEARIVKRTADGNSGSSAATGKRSGLTAASSELSKPAHALPPISAQEPVVGTGLFGTLSLLRQRNMIEKLTDEQKQREKLQRGRDAWIAKQRHDEALLQLERQRIKQLGRQPQETAQSPGGNNGRGRRGKADALTQQELDEIKAQEQEALDRKWAREYEERMKDYKPQVKLEYVDESGRQLSTKEAYKQLSHAFHGHYSGKNKVDRINRQRERERKQQELASSTTTHQQAALLENAHRKMGAAGIDLSQIIKQQHQPSSLASGKKK